MAPSPTVTISSRRTISFELEHFPEVVAAYKAIPEAWQRKVVRAAVRAGAKVVARRAPAGAPAASGRLRAGRFQVRASTSRRGAATYVRSGFVGAVVLAPSRGELGLSAEDGYYPAFVNFGWRVGAAVQGPLQYVERAARRRNGRWVSAAAVGGVTKRQANAELQSVRRKVPGSWWFRAVLLSSRTEVMQAIAVEARARIAKLRADDLAAASKGQGSGAEGAE